MDRKEISRIITKGRKQLETHSGTNKKIFTKIIPNIGEELKPFFKGKEKQICREIQKHFPNKYHRDIGRYCPSKFKRPYIRKPLQSKDDNEIERVETLRFVKNHHKEANEILSELECMTPQEQKFIEKYLKPLTGHSLSELKSDIEDSVTKASVVKQRLDKRRKIQPFYGFLATTESFNESNRHVAKKFNIGRKRLKQIIEKQEPSIILLEKLGETDPYLTKLSNWFKENIQRSKKGSEPLPLPE